MPTANRMQAVAEAVLAKDLEPGDLFSIAGPEYWAGALDKGSIGECVYVRTNAPADAAPDPDATVYRISILYADVAGVGAGQEPMGPTRHGATMSASVICNFKGWIQYRKTLPGECQ